jgi:hypothetical protein
LRQYASVEIRDAAVDNVRWEGVQLEVTLLPLLLLNGRGIAFSATAATLRRDDQIETGMLPREFLSGS